jgi:hypothetical protein
MRDNNSRSGTRVCVRVFAFVQYVNIYVIARMYANIYLCVCTLYAHAIQISLVPLPVPQDDISVSCLLATSRDLRTHKPFFTIPLTLVPSFLPSFSSVRRFLHLRPCSSVFVTITLHWLHGSFFFYFYTRSSGRVGRTGIHT